MNNTELHQPSEQIPRLQDNIVDSFLLFLQCKIQKDNWNEFLTIPNIKFLTDQIQRYGEAIFQDLVNEVSIYFEWPIKIILKDFTQFRRHSLNK